MSKTKFIKKNIDWKDVKNVSRTTVNKKHSEIETTDKFKIDMLISEHSPIRLLSIRWMWEGIKSWVAVHFSRHKWECFVSTQRSDRTGVNRDESPQGALVNFEGEANAQHLIDTARKRLCYCSSNETRVQFEDLKIQLMNDDESYELGFVLVPNCIYRMGCPEFEKCGHWEVFLEHNPDSHNMSIKERYQAYNETFYQPVTK